jgi:hypothetical protein
MPPATRPEPHANPNRAEQRSGERKRCVAPALICLALASCAGPALQVAIPAPPKVATAPPGPRRDCAATIPDSLMRDSQVVYLHAFLIDTGARALIPQADLLAQRVANRLRLLLGGRSDSLPWGEPVITWRNDIGGNVAAILHRNGSLTWQELLPMPIPDTLPTRLVARALAAVVAHGEAVAWTSETQRDSVAIWLAFDDKAEGSYGTAVGFGFPVFALRRPTETRPQVISHGPIRYPEDLKRAGVSGHVIIEAIVDTTGRAERGSLRDLYPAARAPLTGWQLTAYREFVEAAIETVRYSRFAPGTIGGCAVRARVQVPMNFGIAGAR